MRTIRYVTFALFLAVAFATSSQRAGTYEYWNDQNCTLTTCDGYRYGWSCFYLGTPPTNCQDLEDSLELECQYTGDNYWFSGFSCGPVGVAFYCSYDGAEPCS